MSAPEEPRCLCGLCWVLDRTNDPREWPTIPPWRTWAEGTIRVAVPCVVRLPFGMLVDVAIESECEFYGHTLAQAVRAARLHIRAGNYCPVAREHYTKIVMPDGTVESYP